MNPLTNVKNITKLNQIELERGLTNKSSSWHDMYKDSAWLFIGGLSYGMTEGDVLAVFSQYGEIVNINMVRDKKTGKIRGFCFLCYANQKSTILAVDNFNGIKLCGRTIRVDHVAEYRLPKEHEDDDEVAKALMAVGCAPKPFKMETDISVTTTKVKIEGKKKSHERHSRESSSSSDNEPADVKGIKREKYDPGYEKHDLENKPKQISGSQESTGSFSMYRSTSKNVSSHKQDENFQRTDKKRKDFVHSDCSSEEQQQRTGVQKHGKRSMQGVSDYRFEEQQQSAVRKHVKRSTQWESDDSSEVPQHSHGVKKHVKRSLRGENDDSSEDQQPSTGVKKHVKRSLRRESDDSSEDQQQSTGVKKHVKRSLRGESDDSSEEQQQSTGVKKHVKRSLRGERDDSSEKQQQYTGVRKHVKSSRREESDESFEEQRQSTGVRKHVKRSRREEGDSSEDQQHSIGVKKHGKRSTLGERDDSSEEQQQSTGVRKHVKRSMRGESDSDFNFHSTGNDMREAGRSEKTAFRTHSKYKEKTLLSSKSAASSSKNHLKPSGPNMDHRTGTSHIHETHGPEMTDTGRGELNDRYKNREKHKSDHKRTKISENSHSSKSKIMGRETSRDTSDYKHSRDKHKSWQ